MLLVFDLNGTLGYATKSPKLYNQQGIYTGQEIKPSFTDHKYQVYNRPSSQFITYDLLVKQKKQIDIGVWSS